MSLSRESHDGFTTLWAHFIEFSRGIYPAGAAHGLAHIRHRVRERITLYVEVPMPLASRSVANDSRISARRASRLYRLVTTLAKQGRSRANLIRLGRAGMRTFYRDLTLLEKYEIAVVLERGRYQLGTPLKKALNRLPFPAPKLSFADVIALSKGRGEAQSKLKAQLDAVARPR